MRRRSLLWVVVLVGVLAPAVGHTVTQCDQGPTVNPVVLGCAPGADPCVILDHDAPSGCELDFGARAVVFAGTFEVGNAALIVRAARIAVEGQLYARTDNDTPGGDVILTADGVVCAPESDEGTLVIGGTIDVSGNPGGRITLAATCHVDLADTSRLFSKGRQSSSPNVASGGTISALAGGSLVDAGDLDVRGGSGGGGGRVFLRAGHDLFVDHPIDASGGANDGGLIDLLAGDHLSVLRSLDVRSRSAGGGGAISAFAGVDLEGGSVPGGDLLVDTELLADGDSEGDAGFDGGFVSLGAVGTVELSGTASIRASGGTPDGFGGVVTITSGDLVPTRIGALDGDVILHGAVVARAPSDGIGGELDVTAGRHAAIGSAVDLSGGFGGGELTVVAAYDTTFHGSLDVNGRGNEGTGGVVEFRAGTGDVGTTTIASAVDASGNGEDSDADIVLSGCHLAVAPDVLIDARAAAAFGGGTIDLIARHSLTLGTASRYLATPAGPITLVHPPALVPVLAGAVFDPPATSETNDPILLPPCPDCGDGTRQPGEVCDKGTGADGSCCNADCSAFVCPTETPTPTPTPTHTGPTASPTVTPSATLTATPTPGPPVPSATPTPLTPEPKAMLRCVRALAKTSTRFVLADLKTLEQCATRAFACIQRTPPGAARASCLDGVRGRCRTRIDKLVGARQRFNAQLEKHCGGLPPAVPLPVMRDPTALGFALLEPTCQAETGLSLTSHGAIAACVQLGSACAVETSLGIAMPRITDALGLLLPLQGTSYCLPPPAGTVLGLPGPTASDAPRCQRTLLSAGRRLLKRHLVVVSRCVEKLVRCRLANPASDCARPRTRCASALAALGAPDRGSRARLVGKAERACRGLAPASLGAAEGLGFESAAAACAALGEGPLDDAVAVGGCGAQAYQCAADAVIRHALPLASPELTRVGLALPACD